jgi:hypothetical protein
MDRGIANPPVSSAFRTGLKGMFRACHEPLPARMQELVQQLGVTDLVEYLGDDERRDSGELTKYYSGI